MTARLLVVLMLAAGSVAADEIRCAVAANFVPCFETLVEVFEDSTGHTVLISSGSTGALGAQIRQGAPFDAFFAADEETPRRLAEDGFAVPGSRATYAVGGLVLWTRIVPPGGNPGLSAVLTHPDVAHVAVADPRLAPYGRAAGQVLARLKIDLEDRLVTGRSVAQAWHFVASGAAEAGFVARAQIPTQGPPAGMALPVPEGMHEPIEQQAVLLVDAPQAAADLLAFVLGDRGRDLVTGCGYAVGVGP